tara:strand:- start:1846 stop:2574 length:729 start_codon:yes stop_codon:yes gene_type:complete
MKLWLINEATVEDVQRRIPVWVKNISEGLTKPVVKSDIQKIVRTARDFYLKVDDDNPEIKKTINLNFIHENGSQKTAKITIICYMAYDDNYEEYEQQESQKGYIISGMANPNTLEMWFPIIKFIPYPDVPPPSFTNEIITTLIHEIAHLQRSIPRDQRLNFNAKNKASKNLYPYTTDELDANINTIVQMYHRTKNAKDYTLMRFLDEIIPHMVPKFKVSKKTRQKLISKLAQNGVVFRNSGV